MPNDSFYTGRQWRLTRREHLADHPWCAICAALNIGTPGVEVDHVIAKELVPDPYDHANLRTLCKLHHGQKTNALDRPTKAKRRFTVTGLDGWPIDYRKEDP
jgi:5-methylcytosine-specific restriction endonuclease McrA